ncbi:dTMP kinase [Candidatus Saccharibacteria bacterium]|nr:dTMP kinase [Candidatus Saccharibacteria bacterium]
MYIVIEGQDATGKDTQASLLKSYLESTGTPVTAYSESGTNSPDPFISSIAKLNYQSDLNLDKKTRVLLYLTNRYEQWKRFAEPALKRGETVILTRNWLSTLVYEGYGTGVSKTLIEKLHKDLMPEKYFTPDKIVLFTLSESERKDRLISQGKRSSEFFKSKDAEFQQTLNRAYLTVAEEYHVPTLSASGAPEEVFTRLKNLFSI